MGNSVGFTTVAFTTIGANYELLTDSNILNALAERYKVTTDDITEKINDGDLTGLYYQILISGTNVSINNETFQPPFDDSIVTSGDYVGRAIDSIRVQDTGITGQFRFAVS